MDDKKQEYSPTNDDERLKLQANMYKDRDPKYIKNITEYLSKNNIEKPYKVLDAGCGFGHMTKNIFGDDDNFEVIAVDKSKKAIKKAKNDYNASNITYINIDLDDIDSEYNNKFHIVYSTFVLHHFQEANEIISKLWSTINNQSGAFFVRTVDDKLHYNYPNTTDLNQIISSSNEIFDIDRNQGRKIYNYFKRLKPEPNKINIDFYNHNTSNMSLDEQENYFDVFYSYRIHPFERQYNNSDSTKKDKEKYKCTKKQLRSCKEEFRNNKDLFDVMIIPICVAYR